MFIQEEIQEGADEAGSERDEKDSVIIVSPLRPDM